jgi:hypothetical protein
MLKVGGIRTILCNRGPAIPKHFRVGPPRVHHGLDGKHHTRLQPRVFTPAIHIVRYLRFLVKRGPDTMPDKIPNNRKAVRDNVLLNRSTNVKQAISRSHPINRQFQAFLSYLQQPRTESFTSPTATVVAESP